MMTLQQEAYKKISQLPDDSLKMIIDFIDNIQVKANAEEKNINRKEQFIKTAGKINIDGDAVKELRERSMI